MFGISPQENNQGGRLQVDRITNGSPGFVNKSFNIAFTSIVNVSVTQASDMNLIWISVGNISTSGFNCNMSTTRTDTVSPSAYWIAVGV